MSHELAQEMRLEDSSHTTQYSAMEKRLEVTKMVIEEEMREEESRHEQKVADVVDAARSELIALARLANDTEETKDKRADARRELKQLLHKALIGMSSRKNVSLGGRLTIRDGKVFVFNQSNEAGIQLIRKNRHLFEKEDCIDTDSGAFDKVMDALEDIEVSSGYRTEEEVKETIQTDSPLVENLDTVEYSSRNSSRLEIKEKGSYRGRLQPSIHKDANSNPASDYSLEHDFLLLKSLVAFLPELRQIQENAKERYEAQLERRQRAQKTIRQAAAKQLVASSI